VGQETSTTATYRGRTSTGQAQLEPTELRFTGDFRLVVPLAEITGQEAKGGTLTIDFGGETASFALGRLAEAWALKIRYPRSRIEKLGIKAGNRVMLIGLDDPALAAELGDRGATVTTRAPADVIFYAAHTHAELARLPKLKGKLVANGAIWVIRPKGKHIKEITERDVMAAGKAAGLVDVKVVSFSDTHTAEKFVIPVADRAGHPTG
jgi:hypothetical protein